jgi:hypothetical protein
MSLLVKNGEKNSRLSQNFGASISLAQVRVRPKLAPPSSASF